MGGNALQKYGIKTQRKTTSELYQINFELIKRLYEDLSLFASPVLFYRKKETHGDFDLLVQIPPKTNINWYEYIKNTFKPNAIYPNANLYSFDYQNFQIDLILIPENKWKTAITYYSYDPLGNLMGKIFHKFNLSYGWEGLYYKFRNFHGSLKKSILISEDVRKIFEFGGYDYDRFSEGFDTLEDIFQYCISGKYFDSKIFEYENLSRIDRKRNLKRKSYKHFLNYLKENNININYEFNKNKEEYIELIDNFFPEANLIDNLNKLKKEDMINKAISEKFNGDIIMSFIPGIQGKELGNAISMFKKHLGDNYKDFILNNDIEIIKKTFLDVYRSTI